MMPNPIIKAEDRIGLKWPEGYLLRPEMKTLFWSKVKIVKPDECWLWEGSYDSHGYGFFWCFKTNIRSHRVAYFYTYGTLPYIGRHQCDNPPCCNPSHILDGDYKDNAQDCIERGRFPRGEMNGKSKLTNAQVVSIFNDPRSSRTIAKEYGIGKSAVGSIKRSEAWKEVVG